MSGDIRRIAPAPENESIPSEHPSTIHRESHHMELDPQLDLADDVQRVTQKQIVILMHASETEFSIGTIPYPEGCLVTWSKTSLKLSFGIT